MASDAPDPWRDALDAALVSAGLDCLAPDADPAVAIRRLLEWHETIVLDPAISERAQALIERGRMPEPTDADGRVYTKADAEALCSIAVAGHRYATNLACLPPAPIRLDLSQASAPQVVEPDLPRWTDPETQRVMTMTEPELDAALRAEGVDPEAAAAKVGEAIAQASALPAAQQPAERPAIAHIAEPTGAEFSDAMDQVASSLPRAAQQPAVEPVARVVVHKTGGNAGIAWSAVPVDDAPLMRDGELLYASPTAQPAPDVVADARRYAWLRDHLWSQALAPKVYALPIVWGVDYPGEAGKSMDAAIDAELDREGPKT